MFMKKGIFAAVLTAASIAVATNAFAMMGGGGGHGSYYSNRAYPYDHHRYGGNSVSVGIGTGYGWYGHDYRPVHDVRARYHTNVQSYHDRGGYYNHMGGYYDHMDGYDAHYPRQNIIDFSFNSNGRYGYHH